MSSPTQDRDPVRMKKTRVEAETAAFTTQLFYFSMKLLFCYILYKYNNTLKNNTMYVLAFGAVLIINTALIILSGRDPGFESSSSEHQHESENGGLIIDQMVYCDICDCRRKMRSKHCFKCGKCVRKFDHHCPWIGSCVGQNNHCIFVVFTFAQTIQSTFAFLICFTSMQLFQYKEGQENYSAQFGVYAMFSCFMFLYILFVGGLFFFHLYLVAANLTTTQLTSRGKAKYLKGVKGNPFSRGLIKNIKYSIFIPPQGHEWVIDKEQIAKVQRHWSSKICSNEYYDCC